jgi:hypothetical protein
MKGSDSVAVSATLREEQRLAACTTEHRKSIKRIEESVRSI